MGEKNVVRPDFKIVKEAIDNIVDIDNKLLEVINKESEEIYDVEEAVRKLHNKHVDNELKKLAIEEINKERLGIPITKLKNIGLNSVLDISDMSVRDFCNIRGIGEHTAYKIEDSLNKIIKSVESSVKIKINYDSKTKEDTELIKSLYVVINSEDIRNKCKELCKDNSRIIAEKVNLTKPLKGRLKWFFTSKANKAKAVEAYEYIVILLSGQYASSANELLSKYHRVTLVNGKIGWHEFKMKASLYYAKLEKYGKYKVKKADIHGGVETKFYEDIERYPLNLKYLKATLRKYQEFGVKYILKQKRVLLGDEMGLGKTVQAIAAMASLKADGKTHFIVVCPASVLVNWCREIEQHSTLRATKIHGSYIDGSIDDWTKLGGVAVTTYDMAKKFNIPDNLHVGMLIADEAHYVKNPNTQRTEALLRFMESIDRYLFMTGTPLENKVDEMCFLISCLQPEISQQLESIKYLSKAPQFREKLAPVYLRRTRDLVLKELPDLIEIEDWCKMSSSEFNIYSESVMSGNFMAMRQVSWNTSVSESSKAQRLKEICELAEEEGRKVIVFTYFRDTIAKVQSIFGARCLEPITGSVSPNRRQEIVDEFSKSKKSNILISQVVAGGTGLNIQAASVVVFCEPQIKPSIENQAISRTYRMGQVQTVMAYRLLSENSVDERVVQILRNKQHVFDKFADKSVAGDQSIAEEKKWISDIIEGEKRRILDKETA